MPAPFGPGSQPGRGPGLGVGVRFFHPHPPVGRVDILAPPGAPQSQNMHFRKTLGEVLASGGRPGGLTAEVSENHEY